MLTIQSLEATQQLVEIFDSRGYIAVPMRNTPLEELVSASRSDQNLMIKETTGNYKADIDTLQYLANAPLEDGTGLCLHSQAMDSTVDVVARAVQDHFMFARSTVAPLVSELVEAVTRDLANQPVSALLKMEVVEWMPAKPLRNPTFQESLQTYSDTPFDNPKLTFTFPDRTYEQLLEMLRTGANSVDNDIAEWIASKGETFLYSLWLNVFQTKQGFKERGSLREWTDDKVIGMDYALGVYLLARHLADKTIEESNMELSSYKTAMLELRNQAGSVLFQLTAELERIIKLGQLVRNIEGNHKVEVYSDVYRPWLEAGGSVEIMYGNMLSSTKARFVSDINERAEKLKADWNQYAIMVSTADSNQKHFNTVEALKKNFHAIMTARELQPNEAADARAKSYQTFVNLVSRARDDELKDLWSLCLRLVCQSCFAHTEAEFILGEIERISRENEGIDVREAAAMAMVGYIARWVISMIQFVKV